MLCSCGHDSVQYELRMTARGPRTRCRSCVVPRTNHSCVNPYSGLTLEHATDENGRPVMVDSLRGMRDAEKRYKFKSLVSNENEVDFGKPPVTRIPDLFETNSREGKWLFPDIAENMVREMRERGEL